MFSLYSSPSTNPSYSNPSIQSSPPLFHYQHHNQWSPQTPSPLRTSRNANLNRGFMTTPDHKIGSKSSPLATSSPVHDENSTFEYSPIVTTLHGSAYQTPASAVSTNVTDPSTITTASTNTRAFSFSSHASSTQDMTKSNFAFESRSRGSSPSALLSKHAADSREKRKTRFLDRIRSRRGDDRDGRVEEQVLRMDFVRERRVWEETMARRARNLEVEANRGDVDMDLDEDLDAVEREGISPTGDREIEELLGYLEQEDRNEAEFGLVQEEDDDEYDALFMEVLSQETPQPLSQFGGNVRTKNYDSSMDMS